MQPTGGRMRSTGATSWVQMSGGGQANVSSSSSASGASSMLSNSSHHPTVAGLALNTSSGASSLATSVSTTTTSGASSGGASMTTADSFVSEHLASNEEQRQEESRKLRLQLYVFVARCISYPFNARPSQQALGPRHQLAKLRRPQLDQIVQAHTRYLQTPGSFAPAKCPHQHLRLPAAQLRQLDELYERAHQAFNRRFLQGERLRLLVEAECCSQQDLRDLFRHSLESVLRRSGLFQQAIGTGRVSSFTAVQEDLLNSRDAIINSWLIKFESIIKEPAPDCDGVSAPTDLATLTLNTPLPKGTEEQLSKEQLYQMFQAILQVKKFEHQLLFNALQLDSSDEQAAAVRRELDGRIARIAELERNKKLLPKFVLKEMESLYLEEARMAVNKLMVNLDNLPVAKGGAAGALTVAGSPLSQSEAPSGGTGASHHHSSTSSSSRSYGLQKFRRYNNSGLIDPKVAEKRPQLESMEAKRRQLQQQRRSERMRAKHPVASRLLDGAQRPLWSLTFNSLSGFGKIAAQAALTRDGLVESHPSEPTLTKVDVVLTFNIEVIVMEVRGLRQLAPQREIYCTMEIEGSERLQTEHVQAKKPLWDTQGDFTTNHPLPVLKVKLYAVNAGMLSLEDKELGKLVLRPTVLSSKTPEWCTMQQVSSSATSGNAGANLTGGNSQGNDGDASEEPLKIRVVVRMDRPQQLKHCGYLYGIGKSTWQTLKRRYHILIQVSQYTFVMCSYKDKKAKPQEMLQLDGYTVDYIEPPTDLIMEHLTEMAPSTSHHQQHHSHHHSIAGKLANAVIQLKPVGSSSSSSATGAGADSGDPSNESSAIRTAAAISDELHSKFYFNVVREGDSVVFACDDEQECHGWVMALYRATGQAHKPTPLRSDLTGGASSTHYVDAAFAYQASASQPTKLAGTQHSSTLLNGGSGRHQRSSLEAADQRARKHGMDEFISADPCKFQHNHLFRYLQTETLRRRLGEAHCSLGWLSPGQVLVLDEYCARYGVRTCSRHLAYLEALLDFNHNQGYFIDHTLLNYGYDFCASHVAGNSGQAHPMGSVCFDLRPDGVGTVTVEERDTFVQVKSKLLKMIERQIANFSYCFPFGKPDGALKAALSLLERVLMKEQQTSSRSMVQNEEVRQLIKKCLEQAALNNYTKLSGQANLLQESSSLLPVEPLDSPLATDSPPLTPDLSSSLSSNAQIVPRAGQRPRTSSSLSSNSSLGSSSLARHQSLNKRPTTPTTTTIQSINKESQQQQCLTMAMIIGNEQVAPRQKLHHLIRLAELCCEQVELDNEYFSDAFAWHSDLMTEHFELFWSLFSVDMDRILGELATAPNAAASTQSGDLLGAASNREVFRLFQVLNDHMRRLGSGSGGGGGHQQQLECPKFKLYLCDTFKPKLLHYIDIMESSLTRSLYKACERDGQLNCPMVEQMFQRLAELQRFVLNQLRWPEPQLGEQLHQRLKLMAYELCDASLQRTLLAFQQSERKANKWMNNMSAATTTSHSVPADMIQMINLVLETRNRSLQLCTFNNFDQMSYHSKIDKLVDQALGEMQPGLMAKMISVLESTLTKLARYDEGNLLAPILSLTYKQGMSSSGRDIGKQYVQFLSHCIDLMRYKINDELWIVNLLEEHYAAQMTIICNWLGERIDHSLHDVQLAALTTIMPKVHADMSLQGLPEERLQLKTYQTIMSRLKMEEAASAVSGGGGGGGVAQASEQAVPAGSGSGLFNTSSLLSSLTSASSPAAAPTAAGSASGASSATSSASSPPLPPTPLASSNQLQPAASTGQKMAPGELGGVPGLMQARRSQQLLGGVSGSREQQSQEGDNIADRALQSATRMFKGFWT